jgi:hypothetical protein
MLIRPDEPECHNAITICSEAGVMFILTLGTLRFVVAAESTRLHF